MLGIKQETLAAEFKHDATSIFKIRAKEQIEDEMLDKIAENIARFHGGLENDEWRGLPSTILTRLLIAKTNTSFPKIVNTRLIQ